MTVKEQINRALERINRNRTVQNLIMAGAFGAMSVGTTQAETVTQDQDTVNTSVSVTNTNAVKQYHRIVNVNSLDEIRIARRAAAEYNQYLDAIIYTQYQMEDANKFERSQIEAINASNYSVSSEDHEKLHRRLSPISQKAYDGSCILKVSDRIRTKIMEEVCCLKDEDGLPSIMDAIQRFKEKGREDFYAGYYGENQGERSGSILTAMIAEDKVPEKINLGFERSNRYKPVKIGEQEYLASLYVSLDKKYQTWLLHDTDDNAVRSAEIAAQSPIAIGVMTTLDGKEVKMPDGKTVQAQYINEAQINTGGWAGYSNFAVDNFDGRQEGYDFSQAEKNFDGICQEYARAVGLNQAEAKALKEYVLGITALNAYDMSNKEIKEIRDNYKGTPMESLIAKQKNNFEECMSVTREKFVKDELPYLVEVQSPAMLISQNDAKSIKTDAFRIASKNTTKGKGGK